MRRRVLISVLTLCNDSTIDSIQFSELIPKYFLNSLPRVYWDSVVIYISGRMLSRSAQRPCSMLFLLRCVCPMQSTRLTCVIIDLRLLLSTCGSPCKMPQLSV